LVKEVDAVVAAAPVVASLAEELKLNLGGAEPILHGRKVVAEVAGFAGDADLSTKLTFLIAVFFLANAHRRG